MKINENNHISNKIDVIYSSFSQDNGISNQINIYIDNDLEFIFDINCDIIVNNSNYFNDNTGKKIFKRVFSFLNKKLSSLENLKPLNNINNWIGYGYNDMNN